MTEQDKIKHIENLAEMLAVFSNDYLDRICMNAGDKLNIGICSVANLLGNIVRAGLMVEGIDANEKRKFLDDVIDRTKNTILHHTKDIISNH